MNSFSLVKKLHNESWSFLTIVRSYAQAFYISHTILKASDKGIYKSEFKGYLTLIITIIK